jgi:hypothetical protein
MHISMLAMYYKAILAERECDDVIISMNPRRENRT